MRKLTDFLSEKLIIRHQPVDEKLIICHQPVDEKLIIRHQPVDEKLIINKNFKDDSSNDTMMALSIIKKYIDLKQARVYKKKDISRVGKFSKNVVDNVSELLGSSLDVTNYKKLVNICKQFDELDTLYRLHGYDIAKNGTCEVIIKISQKIRGHGKNVWTNDDGIHNPGLNIFRTDDVIIILSLHNSAGWVYIGFNQNDLDDAEPFEEKVDEKLLINKNFKVNGNDEFYETFKESISDLMECQYFTYHRHFNDIRDLPLTKRLRNEINDAFDKAKSSLGEIMRCVTDTNTSIKIYNNMIEYIDEHQNELEMMYNEKYGGGIDFIVKVIETSEMLCAIIGPKRITLTSSYGHIIVAYK